MLRVPARRSLRIIAPDVRLPGATDILLSVGAGVPVQWGRARLRAAGKEAGASLSRDGVAAAAGVDCGGAPGSAVLAVWVRSMQG